VIPVLQIRIGVCLFFQGGQGFSFFLNLKVHLFFDKMVLEVTEPIKTVLIEVMNPTKIILIEVMNPTKIILIKKPTFHKGK